MSPYPHDTYSAGGDQPHENRPPYYTLAYIIRTQ
jgi:microcystin-dependent protein